MSKIHTHLKCTILLKTTNNSARHYHIKATYKSAGHYTVTYFLKISCYIQVPLQIFLDSFKDHIYCCLEEWTTQARDPRPLLKHTPCNSCKHNLLQTFKFIIPLDEDGGIYALNLSS